MVVRVDLSISCRKMILKMTAVKFRGIGGHTVENVAKKKKALIKIK